jgi:hypothetical protein
MGGEFWKYYAPFRGDVSTTLEELRELVFETGRYHRSDLRPATIQEARRNASSDGTRSILDMERISTSPAPGAVSPVPRASLLAIFGTDRPTRQMVERAFRIRDCETLDYLIEEIGRGEGRYFVLYRDDEPAEVFFCGYSYD